MKELTVPATSGRLAKVLHFIDKELSQCACSDPVRMKIAVAVEEIYINIVNYAYHPDVGDATVRCAVCENPLRIIIDFLDGGKPYNPLGRKDPDISLSAQDRSIGGLGVYVVKKMMDDVEYEYKDGKNIFTIVKHLGAEEESVR